MTKTGKQTGNRMVVANVSLSLDGRTTGPGGDHDMSWVGPNAITDIAREHLQKVTGPATTVLLGRKNYEGFGSFWPTVATDEHADPRDRAFAGWLNEVEKIVFSRSLHQAEWRHSRIADADPVATVRQLRSEPGGDIVVLASASVIRTLLEADEIDRLSITLCPELVGGGARLFHDSPARLSWSLTSATPTDNGALCLLYDRNRPA